MTTFYMHSTGNANSLNGDGTLSLKSPGKAEKPDTIFMIRSTRLPPMVGTSCRYGNAIKAGSMDQRAMELRNDILVYSSDVLKEGVEVSGFIETTLYVSSDTKDTDFTIKLIDVYPDGRAYNLDENKQRARYREGYDREVFMEPGKVYKIRKTPMSTE